MAITTLNIKQQVEDGIITLLNADTYITANSLQVVGWFDIDQDVTGRQIVVHANSELPSLTDENGEAGEWSVKIDVLQYIHNSEDETPGTETDTIYQLLMGFVEQVTKAQIQATLTGLVVNGKHSAESAEEYDERFIRRSPQ